MTTKQVGALISRGDFDKDKAIDYYEFLVRFGLEQQAPGKWVFQVRHAQGHLLPSCDSKCRSIHWVFGFLQKEELVVQPVVEAAEAI